MAAEKEKTCGKEDCRRRLHKATNMLHECIVCCAIIRVISCLINCFRDQYEHQAFVLNCFRASVMASPLAAKAKAADKPKANGNKDKWPQLLRGYEGFSCREADKKGKVIIKLVG